MRRIFNNLSAGKYEKTTQEPQKKRLINSTILTKMHWEKTS